MADSHVGFSRIPNEILEGILAPFSTKELLGFTTISKRFHSLITRLLHRRLLQASSLPGKCLIFECYHPSAKISTPSLSCEYIGNKSAKDDAKANEEEKTLSSLHKIYSSFRLAINEDHIRRRRARSDIDIDDRATEDVYLDEGELFSQLCAVTYVAKRGPRPGLFLSHHNLSDGVIRVWRGWLAQLAADGTASESWSVDDNAILWADAAKGVGVRFKVTAAPSERMPLISGPDDHPPVAYTLQYEGMSLMFKNVHVLGLQLSELLIRTTKLLLAVEKSAVLEISHSGRVTTHDAMKIPPFKMFAKEPRTTWVLQTSKALDRAVLQGHNDTALSQ